MQNRRHIPKEIPESQTKPVLQTMTSPFLRKYIILSNGGLVLLLSNVFLSTVDDILLFLHIAIAYFVVEFLPSKQAVAGSSPVSRSLDTTSLFAG